MLGNSDNDNITKTKWSHALSIEELSKIFNVHRNTMSKWLRDQVIRNRQLSSRKWQVDKDALPDSSDEDKISDIF